MIRLATRDDILSLQYESWMGHVDPQCTQYMNIIAYEEDGVVKGLGGVQKIRDHVGIAWVATHGIKNKIKAARLIKAALWQRTEDLDLFRVEAHTLKGKKSGCKLLEWLGFKKEGVCRSWDGFKDYYQYAWVIK